MNEKPEKQPIRVLIVEDDRDFAFLIEKLLRRQEDIRSPGTARSRRRFWRPCAKQSRTWY